MAAWMNAVIAMPPLPWLSLGEVAQSRMSLDGISCDRKCMYSGRDSQDNGTKPLKRHLQPRAARPSKKPSLMSCKTGHLSFGYPNAASKSA